MTIWVDADSCPAQAKDTILKIALKNQINVNYVANRPIPFSIQSDFFKMIVCPKTQDSADFMILENATQNDIVVTRDLLFAEKLLKKNIKCLNDRGILFNQENLSYLLQERALSLQMKNLNIRPAKQKHTYSQQDAKQFSCQLEKLIPQG